MHVKIKCPDNEDGKAEPVSGAMAPQRFTGSGSAVRKQTGRSVTECMRVLAEDNYGGYHLFTRETPRKRRVSGKWQLDKLKLRVKVGEENFS